MKRCFLDTNVVLDLLLNRHPFSEAAENLLLAAQRQQIELAVSSLSFTTVHYVLSKAIGKSAATQVLDFLFTQVTVVAVNASVVRQAITSNQPDFEDSVQLFAAVAAGVEAIITRDPKGFQSSPMPVLDPLAALQQL